MANRRTGEENVSPMGRTVAAGASAPHPEPHPELHPEPHPEPHAGGGSAPRPSWSLIAAFTLGVLVVGGAIGATNAPDEWYRALQKPPWNPPDWVFGPVWTVLYAMVGYAGARVFALEGRPGPLTRAWALQMGLNFLWTPLFFSARSLPLAGVEIAFLLAAVIAFMVAVRGRDRLSLWLFVPYAAWVGFASVLTWTIWGMN